MIHIQPTISKFNATCISETDTDSSNNYTTLFTLSLCSLLNRYQEFGGNWYPHLQGKRPETGKLIHNTRMGGPKIYHKGYLFPPIYPQHHSQYLPLYHHSLLAAAFPPTVHIYQPAVSHLWRLYLHILLHENIKSYFIDCICYGTIVVKGRNTDWSTYNVLGTYLIRLLSFVIFPCSYALPHMCVFSWIWIYWHVLNPKLVNTLDIEHVKIILHTVVVGTIQLIKLSLLFFIYIKVFIYGVGVSI